MAKLVWNQTGKKKWEAGIEQPALFVATDNWYGAGVAWEGVTAYNDARSGGEATPFYANNVQYGAITSKDTYAATLEAYAYPDEFLPCDGVGVIGTGAYVTLQTRKRFALAFKTLIGNDLTENAGYNLHIVYGILAAPTAKDYSTINESPEAITFSWGLTANSIDIPVEGFSATSEFIIDSTKIATASLKALEDKIYGTADAESTLPTVEEIVAALGA